MANRNITTEIWNDPQIIDNFTFEDLYVWLYLLTSPHTYLCGVLKASLTTISFETKVDKNKIKSALRNLQDKHKLIKYSENNNEVLILNWNKYNWSSSEKLKTSVRKSLENVKTKEFIDYVIKALE